MFPDYYTLKTYRRIYNLYVTIGDTTKLPIKGIVNYVYTLNGRTVLTHNALHISALRSPLYSVSNLGVEYNTPTRMDHTCYYLIS